MRGLRFEAGGEPHLRYLNALAAPSLPKYSYQVLTGASAGCLSTSKICRFAHSHKDSRYSIYSTT